MEKLYRAARITIIELLQVAKKYTKPTYIGKLSILINYVVLIR